MKLTIKISIVLMGVLMIGYLLPGEIVMPVKGATSHDWYKASFWYEPWGSSGVHKGIDIFAKKARRECHLQLVLLYIKGP